jgi:hypothetical protein
MQIMYFVFCEYFPSDQVQTIYMAAHKNDQFYILRKAECWTGSPH